MRKMEGAGQPLPEREVEGRRRGLAGDGRLCLEGPAILALTKKLCDLTLSLGFERLIDGIGTVHSLLLFKPGALAKDA